MDAHADDMKKYEDTYAHEDCPMVNSHTDARGLSLREQP